MWWRNRNFLLILSIFLALVAGQPAHFLEPAVLPSLGLVMTLALLGVSGQVFRSPRSLIMPVLAGLFLNFGVNGGLILALAALFPPGEAITTGFVLLAAVPPAVAVVPFAALLKGDRTVALLGTIGCYLGALIITPLMAVGLLGATFVHPWKIMEILVELILVPLALSRLLQRTGLAARLEPLKGALTNWSFALITYIIVGLNRSLFLQEPATLLAPVAIAAAGTFLLGGVIREAARLLGLSRPLTVSLVLLGTMKNTALAGGLALSLFDDRTAVPATVSTIFLILYFVWLSFRHKQPGDGEAGREAEVVP